MATLEDGVNVTDLVATHGPFLLAKTGAIATRNATFDEWEAATTWAQDVASASPWWIADLLLYGEHRYGEVYTQAICDTGLAVGTLMNAVYVGRQIDPSRRRETLPFAHHQEVAPLPPAEQNVWLDRAEADGLSQKQLRMQIKVAAAAAAGTTIAYGLVVVCCGEGQQALADMLNLDSRVLSVKLTTKDA